MTIGIPKEVKTDEFRVGATPSNVSVLVSEGHELFVQSSAGVGSGFSDADYINAGAVIVNSAEDLYSKAILVVKVKEPQPSEYDYLNETHVLFCYLHLAPLKELTSILLEKKVCSIAYETVEIKNELPLLKPMSEIAGKMAPVVGAYHLSRYQGGNGVLVSGADGVKPSNVLIIGAGNAGFNAAKIANGLGAHVSVLNRSNPRLEELQKSFPDVNTAIYSTELLHKLLKDSDIVIGTVLMHGGGKTPRLISKEMLSEMKDGSVIIDIAIDQGGISQSSRPTTHTNPVFIDEGVVHYCVANMPGAYPKTATIALTNATLPYIKKLSNDGVIETIKNNEAIAHGVNTHNGHLTNKAVADEQGFEYKEINRLI